MDPIKGVEKLKKVKLYACSTGKKEKRLLPREEWRAKERFQWQKPDMNEIIMILKIVPEGLLSFPSPSHSTYQNVAEMSASIFSNFHFYWLWLCERETWNLMETSKPDADCDLKFLYISGMFSLWIREQIAEHTVATAVPIFETINEMRCLEKRRKLRDIRRGKCFPYFYLLFNLPSGRTSEFRFR